MDIEQETASIIAFIIAAADDPNPYYCRIPESFVVPAVYFPQPTPTSSGDTLSTYAIDYTMYVGFFCGTEEEANALARRVMELIRRKRNLIPLIDTEGNATGRGVRIKDPSIESVDDGWAQLTIKWTSRRPYDRTEPTAAAKITLNYT